MLDQLKFSKEQTLLMLSASDLETALRNVLSEFVSGIETGKKDEKISRIAASKRLGKDLSTLNRWAKVGKIHPIHVGASVFYSLEEVEKIEAGIL